MCSFFDSSLENLKAVSKVCGRKIKAAQSSLSSRGLSFLQQQPALWLWTCEGICYIFCHAFALWEQAMSLQVNCQIRLLNCVGKCESFFQNLLPLIRSSIYPPKASWSGSSSRRILMYLLSFIIWSLQQQAMNIWWTLSTFLQIVIALL